MDVWDAVVAVISYIFGGLTVHLCYKYKKKTVNHSDNIIGGNADISVGGDSVIAKEYKKTVYVSSAPAKKIPKLSDQAKSIIKQMIENHSDSIIVFEPDGPIDSVVLFEAKKEMIIEDKLRIPDDLNALILNGLLRYCQPNKNQTGKFYALTVQGREYGNKLIEENRGNTLI